MDADRITTRAMNTSKDVLSITIPGFTPDEVYQFKVAAVNEYGVIGEFDDGVLAEIEKGKCTINTS